MQKIYRIIPMPKFDIEITLQRECSPATMLHNFRIPLSKSAASATTAITTNTIGNCFLGYS